MQPDAFRALVRRQIESVGDNPLLRVLTSGTKSELVELTGTQLLARSIELAERYCPAPRSGVVLLLLPHSVELFLLHLGLVLTERLPAILAWPTSRIDPRKYQQNLLHQLQNLPAAQLLTLPQFAQNLAPALPYKVTELALAEYKQLEEVFAVDLGQARIQKAETVRAASAVPEDALFLQFSGGTTGAQKCVAVTAPMLANQLHRLSEVLRFQSVDGVVSWLPMYHDMGLIACFWLPLWNAAPSTQFAASDWLMKPDLLFQFISRFRASFCWLPNFAFMYLAAQKHRMGHIPDLAHVRAWINCSEPVRRPSFRAFTEAFAGSGVRPEQCQASYAMAENVFAVTQTPLGTLPATVPRAKIKGMPADLNPMAYDVPDQVYVSSGRPLFGMGVRIRGFAGELCTEANLGGIEISGDSLFCGYWGNDGFQTHRLTADGWYATGDYGFIENGDLYVLGRFDDVIVSAGQNIFPEDIEALVNTLEGVYPGRVVAFGLENATHGTADLAVIAEMRGDFSPLRAQEIRREIGRVVSSAFGLTPRHVHVLPERSIVKSTAGKISRRETRRRFLEEWATPVMHKPGRTSQ